MSTADFHLPQAGLAGEVASLGLLTFASTRLACAQSLVVFSFIWPFFNFDSVIPGNMMEIDFLLVFVAAALLPEVTLREKRSILLALPVFAVALIWANPTAPLPDWPLESSPCTLYSTSPAICGNGDGTLFPRILRTAPFRYLLHSARLRPWISTFSLYSPEWLIAILTFFVPRYSAVPYDALGIRGVQGWASEPSSAGLMCIAFALIAILQRPDRRWRVMFLFVLVLLLNKSIYFLILTILLGLACVLTLRYKLYALLTSAVFSVIAIFYMAHSGRLAELTTSIAVDGFNRESNHDLMRFLQILNPVEQFPRVYQPIVLNGTWVAEPMGLLPLLAGYGSILGLAWLGYILWRNFPRRQTPEPYLALLAGFVLLIMASPDLIPSIVALAAFLVPSQCRLPHRAACLQGK